MHKVILWLGIGFLLFGIPFGLIGVLVGVEIIDMGADAVVFATVFGIVGGTFVLTGLGMLIAYARMENRHKWLLENGTPVWAEVVGVEDNMSIMINGRPAKMLVATYKNARFTCSRVDNNILMNLGSHVKVLLHPDDANKYTIDLKDESRLQPFEPPQTIKGA